MTLTHKNIVQRFFNSKGQCYASLTQDGVLLKSEKEADRLNIMGKRGYAIDIFMLSRAVESGATQLEIKETTLAGSKRVYRISLSVIQGQSRRVTLAGVPRYAFSLSWCTLVSGIPEKWQVAEHARWLMSQDNSIKKTAQSTQCSLFSSGALTEAAQQERRLMAR